MSVVYEELVRFFFETGAANLSGNNGRARVESAFFHTIEKASKDTRAESDAQIAALQACYDTLLNNAADAHERIAVLEADIKTLNAALVTTSEGNAQLLAENAQLREILNGEPHH